MNITKDVIQDLVVIYMSGEASADTRSLVEEYLAQHPDVAEQVKAAQTFTVPKATPPADLEQRSLNRTRQLLSRKSALLGMAMLLTYLPMSFSYTFGEKHVTFLLLDKPVVTTALLLLGVALWIAFLFTCRQLQATGLEPARSWRKRLLWSLSGMAASAPILTTLVYWTGTTWLYYLVPACSGIALLAGEKLGQLAESRAEPPVTIFGSDQNKDRR
jgi:predicted MFS family arabinose efflux permease